MAESFHLQEGKDLGSCQKLARKSH